MSKCPLTVNSCNIDNVAKKVLALATKNGAKGLPSLSELSGGSSLLLSNNTNSDNKQRPPIRDIISLDSNARPWERAGIGAEKLTSRDRIQQLQSSVFSNTSSGTHENSDTGLLTEATPQSRELRNLRKALVKQNKDSFTEQLPLSKKGQKRLRERNDMIFDASGQSDNYNERDLLVSSKRRSEKAVDSSENKEVPESFTVNLTQVDTQDNKTAKIKNTDIKNDQKVEDESVAVNGSLTNNNNRKMTSMPSIVAQGVRAADLARQQAMLPVSGKKKKRR
eukprot:Tbor_TRINITY_DN6022_c0_g2::TRINITY_DN6022_c0_g2_i3::g.10618::m.10618